MRIAAMAAGAVGGYFGARMAAAGHDVFFIARGAHLEAMRKNGLKIDSVHGDLHLPKPNVTDDPKSVGPVDIVLFAVKLWDTEKAAEAARPLLGANTRVITLQNGVDSYERIAPIVGRERAIPGVTYVVTVIDRPGVIKQASQFQSIICGTIDGRADASLAAFVQAAKAAGINITQSDNIERDRWHKFIFLSGTSGATSLTRSSMGPDPGRPRHARAIPQHHGGDARRRPLQGCRARPGLRRRTPGVCRQERAGRHEGLDGQRSRPRQPAGAGLASRAGVAAR